MKESDMEIIETELNDQVLQTLIAFSKDWEAENSCHGYRANERSDIEGNRIFLARDGDVVIGYLFGHPAKSKNATSIMPEGTPIFEVEELYVVPSRRSGGVGTALFNHAAEAVRQEAQYMMLSTATKNWRAILHFYLEELEMTFWSARMFKKI